MEPSIFNILKDNSNILLSLITAVYVIFTYFLVKTANKTLVFQRKPLITLGLSEIDKLDVEVTNKGSTPATNVTLTGSIHVENKERELGVFKLHHPLNPDEKIKISIKKIYYDFLKELNLIKKRSMSSPRRDNYTGEIEDYNLEFCDIDKNISSKITLTVLFSSDLNPKQKHLPPESRTFLFDLVMHSERDKDGVPINYNTEPYDNYQEKYRLDSGKWV